ncbi:MAG: EthD family reductase, partial [Candidatus Lambdaproteobacteria bacterium]|nr:EthD family reductase [Candidatus Lambdaproteobacteria bacterium]
YWGTDHAALIRKHAKLMGIVRYHQSHALNDPRNAPNETFPVRYDGVAELWFESKEALERWFNNDTPELKAAGKAIRDDERRFADRHHSPFMIADVRPVIGG